MFGSTSMVENYYKVLWVTGFEKHPKLITNTWEVIGHMTTPRWNCVAAVLPNNQLMVVGGYTTSKFTGETDSAEIASVV